jgi:hypothetical protein
MPEDSLKAQFHPATCLVIRWENQATQPHGIRNALRTTRFTFMIRGIL